MEGLCVTSPRLSSALLTAWHRRQSQYGINAQQTEQGVETRIGIEVTVWARGLLGGLEGLPYLSDHMSLGDTIHILNKGRLRSPGTATVPPCLASHMLPEPEQPGEDIISHLE